MQAAWPQQAQFFFKVYQVILLAYNRRNVESGCDKLVIMTFNMCQCCARACVCVCKLLCALPFYGDFLTQHKSK